MKLQTTAIPLPAVFPSACGCLLYCYQINQTFPSEFVYLQSQKCRRAAVVNVVAGPAAAAAVAATGVGWHPI